MEFIKKNLKNWPLVILGIAAVCVVITVLVTLRDPWLWLLRSRFDAKALQAEYERNKALWDSHDIDAYHVTIYPFAHQVGVSCTSGRIDSDNGLVQILEQTGLAADAGASSMCNSTFKMYAIPETFAMAREALAMLAQGDQSGYWFEYFRLGYDPEFGFISMIDIKARPIESPSTSNLSYFVLGVSARYEDFEAK